jgi:TPR repeat protein
MFARAGSPTRAGVTKDYEKALEWYRKAADQNEPLAQANLGVMYARGFGVTKDYEKALEWYRKAAAGGSAMAENNIGIFYLKGLGIPRDRQEAIKCRAWRP